VGNTRKLPQIILALFDILIINLGFGLAYTLRFGFNLPDSNLDPYIALIPYLSISALFIFYMFDLYANWRRKSIYNLMYSLVLAVLILTLFTMALTFWKRGFALPRSVMVLSAIGQIAMLSVFRSVVWYVSKRVFGRKRVLIIGRDAMDGLALAEKFLEHDQGWFIVDGFIPENEVGSLCSKLQDIDVVLLSPDLKEKVEIINYSSQQGKEVLLVPQALELSVFGSELQQVDDMLVLSIQSPQLSASQRLIKRSFDIVLSLGTLILISPFMLLLYVLIPLTSRGPALYKQERLGQGGNPFKILKFRSMKQDAEEQTGPVLAVESDPRITTIGRIIRPTRIDELPQLINVLKGDMSLVGPRPERKYFIDQFKDQIPCYWDRLAAKPGITGLAQIMAKYSTTVEGKLRFDLMYLRSYSLFLDVKILMQTILVVLRREQANGVDIAKGQKCSEDLASLFGNLTGDKERGVHPHTN